MPWAALAKTCATCVQAVPVIALMGIYAGEPGAVALPLIAAIYATPALVGWRRPRTAAFLLVAVTALGVWATRAAGWTTATPLVVLCGLPIVSALALGAARTRPRRWANMSFLKGNTSLLRDCAVLRSLWSVSYSYSQWSYGTSGAPATDRRSHE
jgi:hypothetical protein